jgi:hypothetical protein
MMTANEVQKPWQLQDRAVQEGIAGRMHGEAGMMQSFVMDVT